jgi:hypothetical protein
MQASSVLALFQASALPWQLLVFGKLLATHQQLDKCCRYLEIIYLQTKSLRLHFFQ